jgi:aryl-alcohol dehydrogenase-like predicted oxidoreductase
MDRRDFMRDAAVAAAGIAAGGANLGAAKPQGAAPPVNRASILNYNENMEYRKLGKTGLTVSAVCLGGHWKRVNIMVPGLFKGDGWLGADLKNSEFAKNRADIVSKCIEVGINYIDACTGAEVQAYSAALKGRRDKMYLGFSWYEHEMRFGGWQDSLDKMIEGFDAGLKTCGLDYVDVWRITMHEQTSKGNTEKHIEIAMQCLEKAKKQGKARFTGVSSHDRPWIASAVEKYPQLEVICTPYTAGSKVLPKDSVFDAVRKCNVGIFGIKPFGGNSLFKGDSSPNSPTAEEDDRLARMAIRNILCNPAITAPIPGMINLHQVDNMAKAVQERRELDEKEKAELELATQRMWANLPPDHQWLRNWEYV